MKTLPRTTRRSTRRPLVAAAAVGVALSLALAGCSSGGAGGGSKDSSTLTFGVNADNAPNGYDPLLYSQGQSTFFNGIYDSLFVTDKTGQAQPSLVSSATTSADKLTLTLKLRSGVAFTDGSKLTSAVVKDNLDRRSDKTLVAYGALAAGGAAEIKSIATPDDSTVAITWAKPQATGQNNLTDEAGIIVGPKGLADAASLKTTPDGSGPYTLDTAKTTKSSTYTLVKNTKSWHAKDYPFSTVVFKVITNTQTLANAVVSGQVDVAGQLDASTVDLVKSRQKVAQNGGTIVGFPVADKLGKTNKAFAKVEVRQALNYGTDRDALVKDLHPTAKATAQLFPSEAPGFDAALNTKYAYDPAKAKQLLASAGYPDGFSIDLVVLGQPTDDEIAVQKQWQKIGVKLNFKIVTSTDAAFAAVSTTPLLFGPFGVGGQPAGFVAGVVYGGFMNLQQAKDPNIEKPLGAALGATGDAQAAALTQLNAAITDDGWYIPLYESYITYGYNAEKVNEPVYSGTNGYLLLSQITPAK
ncbi:ABC transporter substrate-binding protein [uncultured Amnibacterium sp.]|uniref:ABC transporter substrate-binding protein n=1 Tax=uncultured Amnibacterium sp. TaxID=1631851 RepID=UPI0035CBEEC1